MNEQFVNPAIASDFVKLMEIQADIEKAQSMIDKFANDWIEKNEILTKLTEIVDKKEIKDEN